MTLEIGIKKRLQKVYRVGELIKFSWVQLKLQLSESWSFYGKDKKANYDENYVEMFFPDER